MKYMAASIPRYMRTTRLSHLRLNAVIGSKLLYADDGQGLIYDIIMLPEVEFRRMQAYLGAQVSGIMTLERSNIQPSYIPQDTVEITVPPGEGNIEEYARLYFLEEFGLEEYAKLAAQAASF